MLETICGGTTCSFRLPSNTLSKGYIVFYKLLGRFFFYFHVLPYIKKIVRPFLRDVIVKVIENFLFPPDKDLAAKVISDKDKGYSDVQIATRHRLSPSKVRHILAEARTASHADNIARAKSLSEAGESVAEIAKRMNLRESSVLAMLSAEN
jgi:hypothetical protein